MTRVAYANSQVLKTSAAFAFDRYVCGSDKSSDRRRGTDNNKVSSNSAANRLYNKTLNNFVEPSPGKVELLNASQEQINTLRNYGSKLYQDVSGGGTVISEGRVV